MNFAAPGEARQGEVVKAIAKEMNRPAILPVPPPALRIVMGEFAGDILASQRMHPGVLTEAGFDFAHADLRSAAAWLTDS